MHRSNKTFSCPHHCCSSCRRSTASAGGLLFRCSDCLTAYCEDCLPQEDVEGDGRNEFLELQAYISKQAFFILCNGCKSPPPAVEPATAMTRDSEDGDGGGDEGDGGGRPGRGGGGPHSKPPPPPSIFTRLQAASAMFSLM